MKGPATPVFLERQSYRQRRLIDIVRLLPIFGVLLWLMPLLWLLEEPPGVPTSSAILFIFAVWILLIGGTFFLTRWIARGPVPDEDGTP